MIVETATASFKSGGLKAIYDSMPDDLKHRRRDKEVRALCAQWKKHENKAAQEIIVASFLPLCIKISNKTAKDYHFGSDAKEELEDVMVATLIETINRFDPEYDNLFYSYALKRMEGAALDFVKSELDLRSSWQKYLFFNLSKLKRQFTEETPSITERALRKKIIAHTHETQKIRIRPHHLIDTEKFIGLVASGQWNNSVDTTNLSYDLDGPIQRTELRPEQMMINAEQETFGNAFTARASESLDKTEWFVIEQLVMQDEPPTIKQLAKKLGVSAEHVTKLYENALQKLREEHDVFQNSFDRKGDSLTALPEHERPKAAVTYYTYETNILISAVMHLEKTGFWPKPSSGKAKWGPLAGRDWRLIDKDIKDGKLDNCVATNLQELLAPYKGIEDLTVNDILENAETFTERTLNIHDILEGAKLYYAQNQDKKNPWPSCKDFTKILSGPLQGETWGTIDKLLRDGGRGLPGGSSLYRLLEDNGLGPCITISDIIIAAKLHHKKTGSWPSSSDQKEIKTGPLKGKSWKGIAGAFYKGYYGLPTDTTLPQVLKENGCYDDNTIDPADIVVAAKLHKEKTGRWPSSKDNAIIQGGPLEGEKWCAIHTALRDGYRGLTANGKGLPLFLKENGCIDRDPTAEDVLHSALLYKNAHPEKKWPTNKTPERINDNSILHGMSWSAVDKRKFGGLSLFQIIKQHGNQPDIREEAPPKPINQVYLQKPHATKLNRLLQQQPSNQTKDELGDFDLRNVFCIDAARPLQCTHVKKDDDAHPLIPFLFFQIKPSNM